MSLLSGTVFDQRETFWQAFVSLRRIEKYLCVAEVQAPSEYASQGVLDVAFQSATVGWPQIRPAFSERETPGNGFSLIDISTTFPRGELSLVCGKIGSGKTLLLLGKSSNFIHFTMAD
jgi:ABC-type multidrug transport system fused ATPase/permease subunit